MSFEEIPEQPDHIRGKLVATTLVATVTAIALCTGVVWLMRGDEFSGGGRSNVEMLDMVPPAQPFEMATTLEREREAQQVELERWMWADPAHTRVVVPVGVAIDRYLEQHGVGP
jgi:hypothetical protein